MNSLTWMVIVVSGLLMAGFGLLQAPLVPAAGVNGLQAQDVLFLMSGGLMTSLLGAAGLFGKMGQRASVVKRTN